MNSCFYSFRLCSWDISPWANGRIRMLRICGWSLPAFFSIPIGTYDICRFCLPALRLTISLWRLYQDYSERESTGSVSSSGNYAVWCSGGRPAIGLSAGVKSTGYRPDGSYQYGDYILHLKSLAERLEDTADGFGKNDHDSKKAWHWRCGTGKAEMSHWSNAGKGLSCDRLFAAVPG